MADDAVLSGTPTGTQTEIRMPAPRRAAPDTAAGEAVYQIEDMRFFYGAFQALRDVNMDIYGNQITALIGPSGCGKTTFLRCLNRMNDLVGGTRVEGRIRYHGTDIYDASIKPIELRRRVGMVFQKPNPFPKSIFENVAFAPRANGIKRGDLADTVESSLRAAVLWVSPS
ncbi:MAG: phosphate ABC transporter ATP-binding protein, partial [Acidimicrobiales bacterium]